MNANVNVKNFEVNTSDVISDMKLFWDQWRLLKDLIQ